ncbi:hypothetical protein OWV82_000459, partial [Melia azedarach]
KRVGATITSHFGEIVFFFFFLLSAVSASAPFPPPASSLLVERNTMELMSLLSMRKIADLFEIYLTGKASILLFLWISQQRERTFVRKSHGSHSLLSLTHYQKTILLQSPRQKI